MLIYSKVMVAQHQGKDSKKLAASFQSRKTQGFCVADFATLSDEKKSRSKIFLLFIWIKEHCVQNFEGLAHSKRLGISQTILVELSILVR